MIRHPFRAFAVVTALLLTPLLAPAQEGLQPADDELRATHGDWELRCGEQEGQEVCYLSQIINNPQGSPLLRAVVNRVDNPQAEAVLTIQAPLGVVLPRGLSLQVDSGEPQQAPFLYCVQNGCYVRVGLQPDVLASLRRGAAARITVYSVQQPDTPVEADVSLIGFTRGYDELG